MKISMPCFALLCFALLSGCASIFNREVEDGPRFIKIGGDYYRVAEPAQTAMLQVGDKGEGAFNPHFKLQVGDKPIEIRSVTQSEIETTSKSAYDAAVSLGIPAAHVSASGAKIYSDKRSGKLNVVNVIELYDLAATFNDPLNRANVETLAQYDNPRIVSAMVFVESLTEERGASGSIKIGADYAATGKVDVSASAGASGEAMHKETLSKGTIFAYQLSRICWRLVDGKPAIFSIVLDRQGHGYGCPANTSDSARQLTASAAKP